MRKEIERTNIGCDDFHDCGSCEYYYNCARYELMINSTNVSDMDISEIKEKFIISNNLVNKIDTEEKR